MCSYDGHNDDNCDASDSPGPTEPHRICDREQDGKRGKNCEDEALDKNTHLTVVGLYVASREIVA